MVMLTLPDTGFARVETNVDVIYCLFADVALKTERLESTSSFLFCFQLMRA
jgi:hypothetical protein